jgi:hypothetical protein
MPPHETQPPFVTLGALPMRVLRNAYEAAAQRRAGSVGTLDVLVQVAVYERRIPPWLLAGSSGGLRRMAAEPRRISARRTVGELVSGSVTKFDPEVQAILREVEWRTRRMASRWSPAKRSGVERRDTRPEWTHGVCAMLAGALMTARDNVMPFASLTHLMFGMLRLPDCDATRHVFPYEYARVAAVERLSKEPDLRRPDQPHPDLHEERLAMWPRSGSLLDRLAGRFLARVSRLARIGPLFNAVEVEARRQAVRLGHDVVGLAHILLAMLTLDATLGAARIPVPASHSSRNRGAAVLRAYGVDPARLRELAACRGGPEEPPAEVLTKQLDRLRPGDPFDGAEGVAVVERAKEISLAYRHPDTGTSHLLLALIEDDAGEAAAILRDLGIDPAAVRERVEQDLRAASAEWPSRGGR